MAAVGGLLGLPLRALSNVQAISPDPKPPWLNIRSFGAVGNGMADDTPAFLTALSRGGNIYVPRGTYLTHRLPFRGQSLIGEGSQHSVLVSYPGEDLVYVPDPSVGENSSLVNYPSGWRIEGIQFLLDNTKDIGLGPNGAFNRPIWPVVGPWISNLRVIVGEFRTGADGKVYQAVNSGITGPVKPSHSAPTHRASDGAVVWQWIDDQQRYVGNAGIAIPFLDGSQTLRNIISATLRDVRFLKVGDDHTNGACAIYSARPFYNCIFDAVTIARDYAFGIMIVPPTMTPGGQTYASDYNLFENVSIAATWPIISFNAKSNTALNLQCYSVEQGDRGLYIMNYADASRGYSLNWTLVNYNVETTDLSFGELSNIQGERHIFLNGALQEGHGRQFVTWTASHSRVICSEIYGNDIFVLGDFNRFESMAGVDSDRPAVVDKGSGNNFTFAKFSSIPSETGMAQQRFGRGSPEGVIVGSPGDIYNNLQGGEGTTTYNKIAGVNNKTGWLPLASAPTLNAFRLPSANPTIAVSGDGLVLKAKATVAKGAITIAKNSCLSGARYAEATVTHDSGMGSLGIGIIGVGIDPFHSGYFLGAPGHRSLGYFSDGTVWFDGLKIETLPAFSTGDVISFHVNPTLKKLWFRKNAGGWNNGALIHQNPDTGAGGYNISMIILPWFVAAQIDLIGGEWTLNFGATPYVQEPTTTSMNW
jgi:hypothetical protein